VAACLALLATACGERGAFEEGLPSIVLVSIDSLRPDHLSAYGYGFETSPFLDQLAREGVRFTNAVSTTSWTLPAHAALFTGLQDSVHGVVDNGLRLGEEHVTLAEVLRSRGYHTAGFFGGPYLHPTFGLAQGFDVYRSCMTTIPDGTEDGAVRRSAMQPRAPSHVDVTGPRTREEVRRWADDVEAERPFFLFVHLWDVHYDYRAPREYVERFDPDYAGPVDGRLLDNPAIRPGMNERDAKHLLALYDAEIRFTDDVLRGILDDLGARGLLEDALVVVTADHGEEFFEHGDRGHNKTLFEEVLRVPLVVRWSGRIAGGRVVDDQVQLIDLLPTLARAARVPETLAVQGRDLTPLLEGGTLPPRDALAELLLDRRSLRALRSNERKVVQAREGGPVRVFDLVADPGERTPLDPVRGAGDARSPRAALEDATARMQRFRSALADRGADSIELTPELEEQLRSLGYLGVDEGD